MFFKEKRERNLLPETGRATVFTFRVFSLNVKKSYMQCKMHVALIRLFMVVSFQVLLHRQLTIFNKRGHSEMYLFYEIGANTLSFDPMPDSFE